ncbi:MAG: hypothetical protein HOV94_38865 [Saccharothrix sp.]|nr:hypothetical protein [Saccharothrix sp.]
MAKMRCTCGNIIRDDDRQQSFHLIPSPAFDEETDGAMLLGVADLVIRCVECHRLWVFWNESGQATGYVEINED